ncbi:peroxisomal-coenzyme A synthetase [Microthyrium microscopicum]|uniref:Peroxisomal-coenzyme A synthetase n=1 Tax=Microthyrium microscopicum TaxID=703497 RepID=A0A6A6U2D9_9PEZI|nr:peroxisomal-coenzyme A synthetase [Microthyrium microscopicum]
MSTLANALPQNSDTAIIVPGSPNPIVLSYQQLVSQCTQFQAKLAAAGIGPQSAVSIALPNSLEFIVSFLATSWQRGIAAPLNPAYKQGEFEFYIDDLKSALLLVPKGAYSQNADAVKAGKTFQAAIAECYWDGNEIVLDMKELGKLQSNGPVSISTARPDDVALVLHTSGTTGRPKAVPLTHANLTRTMQNIQNTYQLTKADRTLLVMPLFHVHGLLAGFLAPLSTGGSVIVPIRFSASEFWKDFINHHATWYTAVPTIHQILLKSPKPSPVPNIRFIRSCSSPLSPKVFHDLERTFEAPVLEAYAMTEAAHQMTSNPLPPAKRMPGSVGKGQGVDVRILDAAGKAVPQGGEGEVCIRGPNVTPGYLNNPSANESSFTADGYFRTGDQGKMDVDGYLFLTGRIKELINKGGEKISPIELDNVLVQNPSVGEAVSFAIADEHFGQDIGIAVVLKQGTQMSGEELREWMTDKVAKFKLPKKVYFTDIMPKTATGKIQRKNVAEAMLKQEKITARL